ncbi:MAG: hypothetical protein CMH64_01570 [Nanoarchaeota archaeon]|nr:hypothetical protein [Nanoarchaeota archaeon]|tara:strand:+ start:3077 stop:3958 length:882 start_codon:yes stop_codon:yes gene_type:complete
MDLRKKEGLGRRKIHKRLCEMGYSNFSGSIQNWLNGMKPTLKEFRISAKFTEEKAFILGVVGPGDGYIRLNKNETGLAVIDKDFAMKFKQSLEKIYGLKCKFKKEAPTGWGKNPRWRVILYSKNVVEDLNKYGVNFKEFNWRIPKIIQNSSFKIKSAYVSAFCDSQGSVGCRRISTFSKNTEGLLEMKDLFESIGLRVSLRKNNLEIFGKRSLEFFYGKIGFSILRKRNKLKSLIDGYKRQYTLSEDIDKLKPLMEEYVEKNYSRLKISRLLKISSTAIKNRESSFGGKNGIL